MRLCQSQTALSPLFVLSLVGCLRLAPEPDAWPCNVPSDCEADESCVFGYCHPKGYCATDVDCSPEETCKVSSCVPLPPPECTYGHDEACGGYGCSGTTCRTHCLQDLECSTGNYCLDGACLPPECEAVTDCNGYLCVGHACVTPCSVALGCAPGFYCDQGSCLPSQGGGSDCTLSDECTSLNCCEDAAGARHCSNNPCSSVAPGAACDAGGECASRRCSRGICAECRDEACSQLVCNTLNHIQCGVFDSTDCGVCSNPFEYCEGNLCQRACIGLDCGSDHGIDCGTCAAGMQCVANHCERTICTAGEYHCDNDRLTFCADGLGTSVLAYCDGNEYCRDGFSECRPAECGTDAGFCDGSWYVPCDGNRAQRGGQRECKDDELTCTPEGCAEEQSDATTADGATDAAGWACGNIYFATATARLVSVEQVMGPSDGADVSWFVFRGNDQAGAYIAVEPGIDGDGDPDGGKLSSPDLDVLLHAGNYYFIGLAAQHATYELDGGATLPQTVAFGQLLGGACSAADPAETIPSPTPTGVAPQTLKTLIVSP